jgi:hypothetical protein
VALRLLVHEHPSAEELDLDDVALLEVQRIRVAVVQICPRRGASDLFGGRGSGNPCSEDAAPNDQDGETQGDRAANEDLLARGLDAS